MDAFHKALQKHGLEGVTSAADGAKVSGWLHSGNFALNWAMSGKFLRGYPLGHVVEAFGDPSTGKSFLIARVIAEALNLGGVALLDDTERAFNPVWSAMALGVDTQRLAYPTPSSQTVQDHLSTVQAYAKAVREVGITKPCVLALDSLALLSTVHEMEHPEKADMTRAKEIKKLFRIMGQELSSLPVLYIITNHTIANIGDIWNPRTTGGGGGVKFQASIRIDLRTPKKLKVGKDYVGVMVRAFIDKNRFAPPWRSANIIIPFHSAIRPHSGLLEVLYATKVVVHNGKRGGSLLYKGEDTGIDAQAPENQAPDFVKWDEAAGALLEKYPNLLTEADAIADSMPAPSLEGATSPTTEEE